MGRPLRIGLHSPYFGSTFGGGEKYLGTAAEILRDAYPQHRVEIVSPVPVDRARYERVLGLHLGGIELRSGTRRVTPLHRLAARAPGLRRARNRFVTRQAGRVTAEYDLWIAMVYVIPAVSAARRSMLLCQFPYELRNDRMRADLEVFSPVVCQSDYVRRCVQTRWHRFSEVLWPPVDVPDEEPDWGAKRRMVLSVGRFVAGGHVKRHDVLVRAFRQLHDDGLRDWELVLAGSLHRDPQSLAYHRRVVELAEGYPVRVLTDAPREELDRLYREAAVYWHAAGYGVDADAHPEALEHFGMTTVEAMSRGAVPVVIGRGGQREVVADGVNGYLWNTIETMVERTREVAGSSDLRCRLGTAARAASRQFGRDEFARRWLALVEPVVAELERAR